LHLIALTYLFRAGEEDVCFASDKRSMEAERELLSRMDAAPSSKGSKKTSFERKVLTGKH